MRDSITLAVQVRREIFIVAGRTAAKRSDSGLRSCLISDTGLACYGGGACRALGGALEAIPG